MNILLVRHGLSEANNRDNVGTLAFAAESAPLMRLGREQAQQAGDLIREQYEIDTDGTAAATSELLRTQQTAQEMGIRATKAYSLLDEVKHGIEPYELRKMLDKGRLPDIALKAAELTLNSPPGESVWISHGLRIAGICVVLGIHQDKRLIPRFCEIRKIEL